VSTPTRSQGNAIAYRIAAASAPTLLARQEAEAWAEWWEARVAEEAGEATTTTTTTAGEETNHAR